MSGLHDNEFIGTTGDDDIVDGFENQSGKSLKERLDQVDKVNGHAGDDVIQTGLGNDLAAGDMVGDEWSYVDGKWVYDSVKLTVSDYGASQSFDDTISTGDGDDVLLGNGGNDILSSGAGDDTINAGRGDDTAYGGDGDDLINLERGDDVAQGGLGNDTVNAGDGDDVVYGDLKGGNVLSGSSEGMVGFSQLAQSGGWTITDDVDGTSAISQSANTVDGQSYTISFELAANLSGGHSSGAVEVLWNGEVVDTVQVSTGLFQKFEVDVTAAGDEGALSFRAISPEVPGAPSYDFDGPIVSYDKDVQISGESVSVAAFAPGQAKLYQVIDGQLKAFDPEGQTYVDVGPNPGFKINSIGFNTEDDLIYGVAKSNGVDALGNAVTTRDLVMLDAEGNAYRIGEAGTGSYTGDFDDSGNLWAFNASLNDVKVIDVDTLDADGNPQVTHIELPNGLFHGNMCDISYNSEDGMFYSVMPPSSNGGAGKVYQIDLREAMDGGAPVIKSVDITGTLYGDQMANGMAKGAYGATFLDGDGNLYYGLNNGDHDLGAMGVSGASGGIFKVNVDWDTGQAYSEYMADAQRTGSNDGAVDPRSFDAFAEVDAQDAVLLRNPELIDESGGNDDLRGGAGNDQLFGNAGNDTLHGGEGNDQIAGDEGADNMMGGAGDDSMSGGTGDDKLQGQAGNDVMSGGAGKDYLNAGTGNDQIDGGSGSDKLVGGSGSDTITGGAGDDHIWGGNWWKDNSPDTFVVAAGSGKDIIHDFEVGHDQIDLSAYGLEFSDLKAVMADKGWATEIDLSALTGGQSTDKLLIKSVKSDDLDESNFIL